MQNLKNRWNRFANARAGTTDYFTLTSSHHSLTRVLLPLIAEHATGRILDLGAGFGTYRPVLEPRGELYVGLDVALYGPALCLLGDGRRLPFPTAAFDTVFCSQVLEHTPEPWALLRDVQRVLRPGGVFILSAPHLSYIHAAPEDYYRYTNYGLAYLLRQAGFAQADIQPAGGVLSLLGSIPQSVLLGLLPHKPQGLVRATLAINRLFSRAFVAFDGLLHTDAVLPLNFIAVARK